MNDTGFGEFFAQGIVILTLRTKHQQSFSRSFSCLIYVWPRQRFIAFRTIKIINNYIFPCNIKLSTTKYIFISCEFFENKYNTSLWHSIANGEKKCDQKKTESSGKSINHWCKKKSKIKQQSKLPKKKIICITANRRNKLIIIYFFGKLCASDPNIGFKEVVAIHNYCYILACLKNLSFTLIW